MRLDVSERQDLYYQQRGMSPTYKGLASARELDEHERRRAGLLVEKLHLPPRLFRGARLVEFGPDSGENALVFARWGAEVTLVEPNPSSWANIQAYFERFGLRERLRDLVKVDLEGFQSQERFDIVVAEGFVYTIPDAVWIGLFTRILAEDGLGLISYYEAYGSLMDLVLRAIHARMRALTHLESQAIAAKLFQTKWDSVPHTRTLATWVMDVLENPSVRLRYFFDARALCARLAEAGFSLYSSWPAYTDGLRVHWHKLDVPKAQRQAQDAKFIARNSLSVALGTTLFCCAESEATVMSMRASLRDVLESMDQLIDALDPEAIARGLHALGQLEELLRHAPFLADSPQDKPQALRLIRGLQQLLRWLAAGEAERVMQWCNTDPAFIACWGLPHHFAVFRKARGVSA